MGVVLGKTPYPGQAMQFPTLFVPIYSTEFGISFRQFPIAKRSCVVYLTMMGAVHGFQQKFLIFLWGVDRLKAIFPVFGIMARGYI